MSVLLTNLSARPPKAEDMHALAELVRACDIAEYGVVDRTMEELISNWQTSSFNLATDGWVIVTTRGQIVAFACAWHRDHAEISMFICVHPQYRKRGIGTLLLRLVEERARQLMRGAAPGARVALRATVSRGNIEAGNLYEREGYTPVREFWRIVVEVDESLNRRSRDGKLQVELDVDAQGLLGAAQLYGCEGVYRMRQYRVYEKELRAGELSSREVDDGLKALLAAG